MQHLKGQESRNKIIKCAAELFYKNGYNSTGIKEILDKTKLTKGSFYFYFKSKKELAIEVSKYYEKELKESILQYYKKDKINFIYAFIDGMIEKAEKNEFLGCPITTVAQELAYFEPDVAKHFNNSLQQLIGLFHKCFLDKGKTEDEAVKLAEKTFLIYEGYLVYFRISKNVNLLKHMKNEMREIFN